VEKEDRRMKEALLIKGVDIPHSFDLLRKNCPKRLEVHHYTVVNVETVEAKKMAALGFQRRKF
jgi:hypothetical protein